MRQVVLNIGLNNNNSSIEDIKKTISKAFNTTKIDTMLADGTYIGNTEPTLVARFYTLKTFNTVVKLVEQLCTDFTQGSIALVSEEYKMLVFNKLYKGEVMDFDEKYFINIDDEL